MARTTPPASGVIAMMQRAEEAGFSYGWTWDSHVLWQEPFVIYSRILSATSALTVGPMVWPSSSITILLEMIERPRSPRSTRRM